MSDNWALEFVGGPLDGRRDLVTPVEWWEFRHFVSQPVQYVIAVGNEIPDTYPEPRLVIYKRGRMRACGPKWDAQGNGYWEEIIWEVWQYEGTHI